MEVVSLRYETFPDPIDNWIIWDRERDDIAKLGDDYIPLSAETEARMTCDLLNQVMSNRIAQLNT